MLWLWGCVLNIHNRVTSNPWFMTKSYHRFTYIFLPSFLLPKHLHAHRLKQKVDFDKNSHLTRWPLPLFHSSPPHTGSNYRSNLHEAFAPCFPFYIVSLNTYVFHKYANFSCIYLDNDVTMLNITILLRFIRIVACFCSVFILPPV